MAMDYPDDRKTGLITAPHLFSTIRVGRVDSETGKVVEALYDQAASYQEAISHGMETFCTEEYPSNDLMRYFMLPDDPQMETAIKEKIRSAHVTVEAVGKTLFARLDLDMAEDLTIQESAALIGQIQSQYRDGWGAEFELQTIPAGNDAVCLRLWHDDISFFADRLKEDFAQQSSRGNAALYDKMAAEQKEYRSWLLTQTPEEILKHSREYAIRGDILAAVKQLDISNRQKEVLMAEPTLLDNIYRLFNDTEYRYEDLLRDAVELWSREVYLSRHPREAYPVLYPQAHKSAVSAQGGQQDVRLSVLDTLQDKARSAEHPSPSKAKPPKKHKADKETR